MSENTPTNPTTPAKTKRTPKTYTCPSCKCRRDIDDQMDSSLGSGRICQDCWDDE